MSLLNSTGSSVEPITVEVNGETVVMKKSYCDLAKIVEAEDKSNQEIFGNTFDLALELGLDIGKENTFKQTLAGNFKIVNGDITGLGGAFVIDHLFKELGFYDDKDQEEIEEMSEIISKGRIPQKMLNFLIGKEVYRVSFVKGLRDDDPTKFSYGTWNMLYADKEKAKMEWYKSVQKGYPRNYAPETEIDDGSTSFNYGANVDSNDAAV